MAPHEPPSWAVARLISWRTRLLAGAVLVGALFLDMLVLGAGAAYDGAAPVAPPSTMSVPSTVVIGVGATARPIPSVPVTVPLVVAESTTSTTSPVIGAEGGGTSAPIVVPVAVAPVAAPAPSAPPGSTPMAPAPAPTPAAIVPPPTSAGTAPRAIAVATTSAPAVPTTIVPAVPSTTTVTTTVTTAVTTTTTTTPAVEYVTYAASSGAGDIVLAVTPDAIRLHGFYPNANWISQTESNGPRAVKLKFFNTVTKRDAEWQATREGNRIQVEN